MRVKGFRAQGCRVEGLGCQVSTPRVQGSDGRIEQTHDVDLLGTKSEADQNQKPLVPALSSKPKTPNLSFFEAVPNPEDRQPDIFHPHKVNPKFPSMGPLNLFHRLKGL